MKNYKFVYSAFLVIAAISLSACVRYIDSRKDIVAAYGFDPAAERTGIEGFYRYEQEQRKRLELLILERELNSTLNANADYKIGPGDEIKISVKNFDEVSKLYTVSTSGSIRLPFVGQVEVQGLTEQGAADMIGKLVTEYVVNPLVDVELTKYSSNVVWVLDNSVRSGNLYNTQAQNAYPIKRQDYSLVDLLIELQNTSYFNSGIVYLYPGAASSSRQLQSITPENEAGEDLSQRFSKFTPTNWSNNPAPENCNGDEFKEDGTKFRSKACFPYESNISPDDIMSKYDPRSRIEIDTEELFGGATQRPLRVPLMAGDLVYIPQPPTIQIYGEVRTRGTFQASNGDNGNGSGSGGIKPSLLSAIAAAHGLTYAADINDVQIFREIQFGNKSVLSLNLEKVVLLAGQDVRLRDGDIIFVPSKHGRFYEDTTINAINSLTGSINSMDSMRDVGQ